MKSLILVALSVMALPALAQEKKVEFEAACGADAAKLCSGLTHKELHKCMREHSAQLSQACADFVAAMKERHRAPPP